MMSASSESPIPEGDKDALICALRDQVLKTHLVASNISTSRIWQHGLNQAFSLPPVSDPSAFEMRDTEILLRLTSVFRFRFNSAEPNLEGQMSLVRDAFAAAAKNWEENYRPLAEALAGNGNRLGLGYPAQTPKRDLQL